MVTSLRVGLLTLLICAVGGSSASLVYAAIPSSHDAKLQTIHRATRDCEEMASCRDIRVPVCWRSGFRKAKVCTVRFLHKTNGGAQYECVSDYYWRITKKQRFRLIDRTQGDCFG